ncbi:MAG: histidinol-phosphate transaminase [Deinococcales bacterium]
MYKLSSNENPLGASPKALAAIEASLKASGRYPAELEGSLEKALAHHHKGSLSPEHVVTGASGCDVLALIARAYLDAESEVIVCPPTFPTYQRTAEQMRAKVIQIALSGENFDYQLEAIVSAITSKTKLLYLCNPNNPTGTIFGQAVFDKLLALIPPEVIIVYDEVYYHFSQDLPDSIAAVLADKPIILVHSFSKVYGLAGLRLGYAIARADITAKLTAQKNPFHLSRLTIEAGLAALEDDDHVQKTLANNELGMRFISEGLKTLGLRVWPSATNFVMFEVPKAFKTDEVVTALAEAGVGVRGAFGLEHHLRVSIGLPEANEHFITSLSHILQGQPHV